MKRSHVIVMGTMVMAGMTLAGASSQAQTVFDYADFNSTTGLTLNGVAVQTAPTLAITPPVRAAAGSVWYSNRVPVASPWFSTFDFRVRDVAGGGADGFAFVIQNSTDGTAALGSQGGSLGYADNPVFPNLPGIANSVAIEFDLWNNEGDWSDFNSSQHVSVQCRGLFANSPSGNFSMGESELGLDLSDGLIHLGQVQYTGTALNVFIDLNQVLSVPFVIPAELGLQNGTDAFVGLTASTGSLTNVERHELLSWDFNVIPNPGAGAVLTLCGLGMLAIRRRELAG